VPRNARTLVIACGAIAHELVAMRDRLAWPELAIQCLPADWHNRPERIAPGVEAKLETAHTQFDKIFVAYADCGTGGELDVVLARFGVERLAGSHCYEFFAGTTIFEALAEEELGTFYLTDFLARHFERLIIHGLGIDRHPELLPMYFGNYKRLLYLAQRDAPELDARAEDAARRLGLEYVRVATGLEPLAGQLVHFGVAPQH
jgi:hypothetical protein